AFSLSPVLPPALSLPAMDTPSGIRWPSWSAPTLRAGTDKTQPGKTPSRRAVARHSEPLVITLGEQLFEQEHDTPAPPFAGVPARRAVPGTARQRSFSGTSNASHTASHTIFGSTPSASAWSTVRPPTPASA